MNNLLIIASLTILYYIVLFYLDKKGRMAFKLAQKKVIGTTTPLLDLEKEKTTEFFGAPKMESTKPPLLKEEKKRSQLMFNDHYLEKELEELAIDLEAEQSLETSKDNLMNQLAASAKENLEEKDISKMMASISKSVRR